MYPHNLNIKIRETFDEFSDNTALIVDTEHYSYGELDQASEKIANFLCKQRLAVGEVICIESDKSFNNFAVMIACLKIGVAYCNIDPENPISRTQNILETCQPNYLVNFKSNLELQGFCSSNKIICLSYEDLFTENEARIDREFDGYCLAYIMFTSGSTGKPKGVAITHQNVLHFSNWIKNRYRITPEDNFANLSPLYFDNSVFDVFEPSCMELR